MAKSRKTARRNPRFTEEEFYTVRKLVDAGLSQTQITNVMDGRRNPINLIMANDLKTWEEYRQKRTEESEARKAKSQPAENTVRFEFEELPKLNSYEETTRPEPEEPMLPEDDEVIGLAHIYDALGDINRSLKRLAEAWESHPEPATKKRGFFNQ